VPREALISGAISVLFHRDSGSRLPLATPVNGLVAVVSDLANVSFRGMWGPSLSFFLPYLWIAFGNGFRFGIRFLYRNDGLSRPFQR